MPKQMRDMNFQAVERTFASAGALAQHQALPSRRKPLRLPTFPAIERTGVKAFNMTNSTTMGSTTLNTDARYYAFFRTPSLPLWESVPTLNTNGYGMARRANLGAQGGGFAAPNEVGESQDLTNYFQTDYTYEPISVGDTSLAGAMLPYAIDDNKNVWFYAPNCTGNGIFPNNVGQQVGIRFKTDNALGPLGAWVCQIETLNSWTTSDTQTYNIPLGYGALNTHIEGYTSVNCIWWRPLSLTCTTTTSVQTTVNITDIYCGIATTGSTFSSTVVLNSPPPSFLMPKVYVPREFDQAPALWQDTRCTAACVLFQNVTAVLYKEGTAKACRLLATDFNAGYSTSTLPTNFGLAYGATRPELKYNGQLARGFYTFAGPDQASSNFRDWTVGSTTSGTDFQRIPFRLDAFAYVNFIELADVQSVANSGTVLSLTTDFHIEFRSTSTLWDVAVTRTSLETWHRAQVALSAMPCFFENLTHMEEVANIAARLAGFALGPQGKVALSVGRAVGPPIARAAFMVGKKAWKAVMGPKQEKKTKKNGPPKPQPKKQAKAKGGKK